MSQYNIFQAIYLSFFSKKLYRDVASTWGGKAFLYAFFVLALSWIGSVILMQQHISNGYVRYSSTLVKQLPVITVTSGKVSTPENRPYLITEPDSKETLVIIDTSGKYQNLAQADAAYLITQDSIIAKDGDTTKITKLPVSLTHTFEPTVMNERIKSWVNYAWILMLPGLTLLSFILMVMKALIYGLIGRIFSAITDSGVSFFQCMGLYCVAATPALAVWTVLFTYDIIFAHRSLLIFVLVLIYLFYGILANKPAKEG
jgi:hypothetical protein